MQLVANYRHTPSQVCAAVYCDTLCHQLIICQSWLTFIGLKEIHLMRIGHRVVGCRPSIRSTVPRTAARLPLSEHGRCAYIYRNETQRSSQMGDYSQLRTFFLTCFHSYASICATFKVRPAPLASDKRQEIALLSTCEACSFEYCRRSLIASLISFVD